MQSSCKGKAPADLQQVHLLHICPKLFLTCLKRGLQYLVEGENYLGEDASKEHLQSGLLQALVEGHQAQVLRQVLEQDLDEDAAAGCGVLLSQPNARQHRPADGIRCQQVLQQARRIKKMYIHCCSDCSKQKRMKRKNITAAATV